MSLRLLRTFWEAMRIRLSNISTRMVSLDPGQRGGIVWRFDKAGTADFACLVPGHLEAGMVGKIQVE